MIWIKIFAGVGILACAVILVAVGGVVVTAIQDRRQRRFARLDDRIDDTKSEINMWLTDNQKRLDSLEERISFCKASVEKIDSITDGRLSALENDNLEHREIFDRLSRLETDLNKHIGYLDTVYDALKWNLKALDFERIMHIEDMIKTMGYVDTEHHNRITALELRLDNNSTDDNIIYTKAPE